MLISDGGDAPVDLTGWFADPEKINHIMASKALHNEIFAQEMRFSRLAGRYFHAQLAIRHSSGILFQSAHNIIESDRQMALFGMPSARSSPNLALRGIHYTPVSLARTLVSLALRDLPEKPRLRILDPTCGSGIFLVEAVHELRKLGLRGHVELVGVDNSQTAISAAQFTFSAALRIGGKVTVGDSSSSLVSSAVNSLPQDPTEVPFSACFICADAFEVLPTLGLFDIVLMNPPFVNWEHLTKQERFRVKKLLGSAYARRPDLAMAFVTSAIDRLENGRRIAAVLHFQPKGTSSH